MFRLSSIATALMLLSSTSALSIESNEKPAKKTNHKKAKSAAITKDSELLLKFTMRGKSVEGANNKAKAFGLKVGIDGKHHLASNLHAHVQAGIVAEKGSSESVHQNPHEPKSYLSLTHAILDYRPFNFLKLQGGAINQRHHHSPLFIDNTAFLGAREAVHFGNKIVTVELSANQSIPSNRNLSTRLGKVDEGNPVFFAEKAKLTGNFDSLKGSLHVQHFAYDSLSSAVAYESQFLGNDTTGVAKEQKEFTQKFIGWEGGVWARIALSNTLYLHIKSNFHTNTQAQSGENRGTYAEVGGITSFYGGQLDFYGLMFENQKNSVPAYYTPTKFGGTNRKGYGVKVLWKQKSQNLKVKGQYISSDVLLPNSLQSDDQIFYVELGKAYEIF